MNIWNGLEGVGRDDLGDDKNPAYGNEPDPISLTLSRHSITSTAVSPVNCKISFRLESSASNSVNLLTSSPKSNSPSSSCLGLGRESTTSDVVTRATEGERIRGCSDVVSDDKLAVWKIAYWRWKAKTLCREWKERQPGQDTAEVRSKSRIALDRSPVVFGGCRRGGPRGTHNCETCVGRVADKRPCLNEYNK